LLFWEYWFDRSPTGVKRFLHRPLDMLLQNRDIEASFAVALADFPLTLKAQGFAYQGVAPKGRFGDILVGNPHSVEIDTERTLFLAKNVFSDPRYLRVDGRPFLGYFGTALSPSRLRTIRQTARSCCGMKLYVVEMGLGSFARLAEHLMGKLSAGRSRQHADAMGVLASPFGARPGGACFDANAASRCGPISQPSGPRRLPPNSWCRVYRYSCFANTHLDQLNQLYDRRSEWAANGYSWEDVIPGVMVGWDNTPRYPSGNATIVLDSSPSNFHSWMFDTLWPKGHRTPSRFVIVNAINEWGEGNHLEPDAKKYKMQWYAALDDAKNRRSWRRDPAGKPYGFGILKSLGVLRKV